NTIFAQIFAGSPREREGFVGSLLKAMAWITLALAPILVVLAFQVCFLSHHSEIVTSTHRILILIEIIVFFVIWPLALDAQLNFQWPNIGAELQHFAVLPLQVFRWRERSDTGLWRRSALFTAGLIYVCVCFIVASSPGEPHINLLTGYSLSSVQ